MEQGPTDSASNFPDLTAIHTRLADGNGVSAQPPAAPVESLTAPKVAPEISLESLIERNVRFLETEADEHDRLYDALSLRTQKETELRSLFSALGSIEESPPQAYEKPVSLVETLEQTNRLFDRVGIHLPTVEQLSAAGVDLAHLNQLFWGMVETYQQPEWILAPVLRMKEWDQVFDALEADPTVNHDYVHQDKRIKKCGVDAFLYPFEETDYDTVLDLMNAQWQWPDSVPHILTGDDPVPVDLALSDDALSEIKDKSRSANLVRRREFPENYHGYDWTLRLVPTTLRPAELAVAYSDPRYYSSHPTASEYLTLQAARIQAGEVPLDNEKKMHTWLYGKLPDPDGDLFFGPTVALTGTWQPNSGQVELGLQRTTSVNVNDPVGARRVCW
jgi:hypothetical protein